ncbi:hypothetical protein TWF694_004289 [Orbilia ellipsospora]|uniref:Uncharacterized protein n=1 Tax=Orbilia ellipsospora TaxID=2528407 RepID=A0AAV9X046_9PEZI
MFFIRFLKVPTTSHLPSRSKGTQGLVTISALITISTDLSESYYTGNVLLRVTLRGEGANVGTRPLVAQEFKWTQGMRSLPVQFSHRPANGNPPAMGVLCVSAAENRADDMRTLFARADETRILSAWSMPFDILTSGAKAEGLVERKLQLGSGMIRIWEETREDIARHIWPGGLAISAYFSTLPSPPTGVLESLIPVLSKPKLQVLELGAGCGVAGLALASSFPESIVTLTDLPITAEITARNIGLFTGRTQRASNVTYSPLDWSEALPSWCESTKFDLILVADCTYNTSSIPYLVKVLDELSTSSPGVVILLAHKVRHDSEQMFFDMAGEKRLKKKEEVVFEMAGDTVDLYVITRVE